MGPCPKEETQGCPGPCAADTIAGSLSHISRGEAGSDTRQGPHCERRRCFASSVPPEDSQEKARFQAQRQLREIGHGARAGSGTRRLTSLSAWLAQALPNEMAAVLLWFPPCNMALMMDS